MVFIIYWFVSFVVCSCVFFHAEVKRAKRIYCTDVLQIVAISFLLGWAIMPFVALMSLFEFLNSKLTVTSRCQKNLDFLVNKIYKFDEVKNEQTD